MQSDMQHDRRSRVRARRGVGLALCLAFAAASTSSPATAAFFAGCVTKTHSQAMSLYTLPTFGLFPPVEVHTILVAIHLAGLCFGLGGATLLDVWIVRWIAWGYLPKDIVRSFEFISKSVSWGLVLLWISGLSFLVLYDVAAPEKLENPKVAAKLIIVLGLTVNGWLLHRFILPRIGKAAPSPIFADEPLLRRCLFIGSGAISGVSWYGAFSLGLLHEFNCTIRASAIISAWAGLCVAAAVAACVVTLLADWMHRFRLPLHSAVADGDGVERGPALVGWLLPSEQEAS